MVTGCPHNDCPCASRCLRSHCPAEHLTAYDQHLKAAQTEPVTLRVLTGLEGAVHKCDGTYTCPCADCDADRAKRAAQGAGAAQFKPRPPRRLRSAA